MQQPSHLPPTMQAYTELQIAYDYFNKEIFKGELPPCLIILYNKERRTFGYFVNKQFINAKGQHCDCIAMNPQYFAGYSVESIMQTLVHEMCHLWQYNCGNPSRKGYHNKEWGDKMEALGLMPSNTGKPGGRKLGQQMMDYVIEGGMFQKACNQLVTEEFKITWYDRFPVKQENLDAALIAGLGIEAMPVKPTTGQNKSNRIKYTCPGCKANAWGKPHLNLICGDCEITFTAAEGPTMSQAESAEGEADE